MSEHKYNEAWKKGFDSGVETQKQSCIFDCGKDADEYDLGYQQGKEDVISECIKKLVVLREDKHTWENDDDYFIGKRDGLLAAIRTLQELKENQNE